MAPSKLFPKLAKIRKLRGKKPKAKQNIKLDFSIACLQHFERRKSSPLVFTYEENSKSIYTRRKKMQFKPNSILLPPPISGIAVHVRK